MRISDWSSDVCSSDLVAAGIRSLLLEFLPADQPRQQAVIGQIERIELIETLERVEVSAAALDQIEHRFIEYRDRELDRLAAGVARRGGKLDPHRFARFGLLFRRRHPPRSEGHPS